MGNLESESYDGNVLVASRISRMPTAAPAIADSGTRQMLNAGAGLLINESNIYLPYKPGK